MWANEDQVVIFRFAPFLWVSSWAKGIDSVPKSRYLDIVPVAYDNFVELSLVSFEKTIAIRRRCKPEECQSCDNRYNCEGELYIIGDIRGLHRQRYEEKETCRVKYIVTDIEIPVERLGNNRHARYIQKHIQLVLDMLNPDQNQEILQHWTNANLFPHKSMMYPIVITVNSWSDEINPYSLMI